MPSSVILAMRYRPGLRELYVVFRSTQDIYRYFDVGMEEWQEFLEATSKGTYLNSVFKARDHRYEIADEMPVAPPLKAGEAMEWGEAWALRKKDVPSVAALRAGTSIKA